MDVSSTASLLQPVPATMKEPASPSRRNPSPPEGATGLLRLLFSPLEPVIVPAQHWQRGSFLLPRTALAPIGAMLRAAMPKASELEAQYAAIDASDPASALQLGRTLWPLAAAACDGGLPPGSWQDETGLTEQDRLGLTALAAAILHAAVEIDAVLAEHRGAAQYPGLRTLLKRAAPRGPAALGAIVAILLAGPTDSERVVAYALEQAVSAASRIAVDAAVETALDGAATIFDDFRPGDPAAVSAIPRIAALLDSLEPGAAARPQRRRRIEAIRRDAAGSCRQAFQHIVTTGLLHPLANGGAVLTDSEIDGMEASARELRHIEASGRQLRDDECQALLKSCRTVFRSDETMPLTLADRVRMLEILGGPDEALALLAKTAPRFG